MYISWKAKLYSRCQRSCTQQVCARKFHGSSIPKHAKGCVGNADPAACHAAHVMGKRKANAVADCATRLVQHRSLNAGVVAEVLKELEACDLLRGEAPEKHALKKRCWRRRAAWLEKVAVNAPLPMADGTTEDWVVADPVKLWEERAARDPSFLELLSTVLLKGPSLEVLLYLDEATAGDPLHPDPQRKAWMFYVTFTAAGMNMQHHRAWQTVAVLRNARARRALAGLSGMCRALLKTWYEAGIFQGRMVQMGSSNR